MYPVHIPMNIYAYIHVNMYRPGFKCIYIYTDYTYVYICV